MSSLIFYTSESLAIVATDTLAMRLDEEDGTVPAYWTSKAFIVPHLRMIIAGTGFSGFAGRWFVQVNDRMLVTDNLDLDRHTPELLRQQWRVFLNEFNEAVRSDKLTTTIYHFGFSRVDGKLRVHAYRSVNNFESELVGYGTRYKPELDSSLGTRVPEDLPLMMKSQRAIQESRPSSERLYIGGEIEVIELTEAGYHCYSMGRFDDFDETERAMFAHFK